jgi:hypothetical protein
MGALGIHRMMLVSLHAKSPLLVQARSNLGLVFWLN